MTNDMIRKSDALAALDWGDIYGRNAQQAISALPAVTVGVKPLVFEGRNGFWRADDGIGGFYEVTEVYSAFHMCRIVVGVANKLIPYNSKDAAFGAANVEHQRRIRAALEHAAPDPAAIRDAALEIWKHANSRDPDDPVFIAAILALIPTKATADPAVNAPDYILAPHFQRIVEGAKNAPQWDTVSDRMAATDPTEYERKVAQMKEDFPNGI